MIIVIVSHSSRMEDYCDVIYRVQNEQISKIFSKGHNYNENTCNYSSKADQRFAEKMSLLCGKSLFDWILRQQLTFLNK